MSFNRTYLFGLASIDDKEAKKFAKTASSAAALESVSFPDYGDVPVEDLCRIESLFRMFDNYNLRVVAQAKLMGQDTSTIESQADLREVVHALAIGRKNAKVWERIELLEKIAAGFARRYGNDIGLHMYYQATLPTGKLRKFRNMLEDGNVAELSMIAEYFVPAISAN